MEENIVLSNSLEPVKYMSACLRGRDILIWRTVRVFKNELKFVFPNILENSIQTVFTSASLNFCGILIKSLINQIHSLIIFVTKLSI